MITFRKWDELNEEEQLGWFQAIEHTLSTNQKSYKIYLFLEQPLALWTLIYQKAIENIKPEIFASYLEKGNKRKHYRGTQLPDITDTAHGSRDLKDLRKRLTEKIDEFCDEIEQDFSDHLNQLGVQWNITETRDRDDEDENYMLSVSAISVPTTLEQKFNLLAAVLLDLPEDHTLVAYSRLLYLLNKMGAQERQQILEALL